MSRSFFEDLLSGAQQPTSQFEAADSKTLRLAAHPLTEEDVAALIRYQEAFLAHAELPSADPEALVSAHQLALQASGFEDVKIVELGLSMLRAFCGPMWTAQRLRGRLAELEKQPDAASTEKASRIREELFRVENLDALARRYSQQAIDLLRQHESALLALHDRMQKVLTRA
jgi:hypothetical protein